MKHKMPFLKRTNIQKISIDSTEDFSRFAPRGEPFPQVLFLRVKLFKQFVFILRNHCFLQTDEVEMMFMNKVF